MADKHTAADINRIGIQEDADSIPLDDNFQDLKTKDNEIIDQVNGLLTPPVGNEVSNARPYHTVLKDRLDSTWNGQPNYIKFGGDVSLNSTAYTVDVTAGEAKINGIDVLWGSLTSGVISRTESDLRYDVVVIKSDSTLQINTGTESTDPVLPTVSATQKALAVLYVTGDAVTIHNDARNQGAWYMHDGQWKYAWKIQSAIDDLETDEGGHITIGGSDSRYYEDIDLTGYNNVTLDFQNGAKVYRLSASNLCLRVFNTIGNETTGIKILNGDFRGNGKSGANELLKVQYLDEFIIKDCRFDGNVSSTATNKNWTIVECDNFFLDHNLNLDSSGDVDYAETGISSATNYMEDGYYKNQVTFCGVTGQKAQMIKMGWVELTAMDNKFLRIDKDTAGTTDGNDDSSHNHSVTVANDGDHVHSLDVDGVSGNIEQNDTKWATTANGNHDHTGSSLGVATMTDNKPAYYTLIALIHR